MKMESDLIWVAFLVLFFLSRFAKIFLLFRRPSLCARVFFFRFVDFIGFTSTRIFPFATIHFIVILLWFWIDESKFPLARRRKLIEEKKKS